MSELEQYKGGGLPAIINAQGVDGLNKRELKIFEAAKNLPTIAALGDTAPFHIKNALIKCKIFVGANNEVDDLTIAKLVQMISEHFSEFTAGEIEKAFDLAMLGEFDIPGKSRLIEHFGSFSVNYVVAVLTNYRIYRSKVLIKAMKTLEQQEQDAKQNSPGALDKKRRNFINVMIEDFDKYNAKGPDDWFYFRFHLYYDYLNDKNLFTIGEQTIMIAHNEAKEKLKADVRAELDKSQGRKRRELLQSIRDIAAGDFTKRDLELKKYFKVHEVFAQLGAWKIQGRDFLDLINEAEGFKK